MHSAEDWRNEMFTIEKIPENKARGWTVWIDGEKCTANMIELTSQFGTLSYGLRPEGYDGWVFREVGGGGAVTVPYTRTPEGVLLVGLIEEKRANMGQKPVWCTIGGFVDPGEAHDKAQVRVAGDESGLDTAKAMKLDGLNTNPNRAFFVADTSMGEGVHAYGLEIPFDWLEAVDTESYKLKDTVLMPGFKKVGDVRLFPWRMAITRTADALARSAIAQLLAMEL